MNRIKVYFTHLDNQLYDGDKWSTTDQFVYIIKDNTIVATLNKDQVVSIAFEEILLDH